MNDKIDCDNTYDVSRQRKDNKVPYNNENRGKESLVQHQRSSASPTSNIWLRLIEDEENIGNPNSIFFPLDVFLFPSKDASQNVQTENPFNY